MWLLLWKADRALPIDPTLFILASGGKQVFAHGQSLAFNPAVRVLAEIMWTIGEMVPCKTWHGLS
jgi:hypothetical protein